MNFNKWKNNYSQFIKRRIERMISPYFFMSIFVFYPLWYIASIGFSKYKTHDISAPIDVFVDIFYATSVGNGMAFNPPLWFLPCLFMAELIFFGVLTISKNNYTRCFIVCVLAIIGYHIKWMNLPWGGDIALAVQFFLFFGYIMRTVYISKKIFPLLVLVLVLINNINEVDIAHRNYGNLIYCYIGGAVGTLVVLQISQVVCKHAKCLADKIANLGKESMTILMWHGWVMKVISALISYCVSMPFSDTKLMFWHIIVICTVMLSLKMVIVKNIIQKKLCNYPILLKYISW